MGSTQSEAATERTVQMAVAELRDAADRSDWHGFGGVFAEFSYDSGMRRVALRVMRKALVAADSAQAAEIIDWLTPETLTALRPAFASVRSFAEALMQAPDITAVEDIVKQASELAIDDSAIAAMYVRILGRQNRKAAIRQFIKRRPDVFASPEAKFNTSEFVGLKSDERQSVIDYIENLPDDAPPQFRMMGIRWLFTIGEEERAQRIAQKFSEADAPEGFDAAINILRRAPGRPSRLAPSERHPEILVGHSVGDRGAVIFFGGIGPGGMNGGQILDRYLADIGLTMIAVSDEANFFFMAGIPGVADTIDGAVDALKALVTDIGIDTIYTTGGSAGGFSAAIYGLQLSAAGALLFGSPTSCGTGIADIDKRARVVVRRLQSQFDDHELDMITWLDRSDHELPITLYYAADNKIDSWHANRLAGRPHVRLVAMADTASHQAMLEAARDRSLGEVFAEAFNLSPSGTQ